MALLGLNTDEKYLKAKDKAKENMLLSARITKYLQRMNLKGYYRYLNNIDADGTFEEYNENSLSGVNDKQVLDDTNDTHYDEKWMGYYSNAQIKLLENKYNRYLEDFGLNDYSAEDYAMKIAKASLAADVAQEKYARGKIDIRELRDAIAIFDNLSKSAEFAKSKQRDEISAGLGTFGEMILALEQDKELKKNKVIFPKDDIDKIIEHYAHIATAVGKQL